MALELYITLGLPALKRGLVSMIETIHRGDGDEEAHIVY
ncbi:hypothetical protein NAS2_1010 [Conexivisphaera calida]|uniref:Uncharacterized protein n=1 Tax=Conexivisphaera calida TaxID=1874277 RepID=A0A4P2VCT4_9ARCH|nr:hypothetical protein NAS2_1010 [Conexivisphaera calida]